MNAPTISALTLSEFVDLPGGGASSPDDARASARLRAAVRAWRDAGHNRPGSLEGLTETDLAALVTGRSTPPSSHEATVAVEWLDQAVRSGQELPEPGPDWHAALLRIVAPALDHTRHEAAGLIATAGGCELAGRLWLRNPPVALVRLLTGAFVLDMQAARKLAGEDSGGTDWFERHLADVCRDAESRTEFLARYPLLARLIGARLRNWQAAAVEFAQRLERDLPAIGELLGGARPSLRDVTTHLGDAHRHGRTVARVDFDEGSVAYKPQAVNTVTAMRRFVRLLGERYGVEAEVFLPAVVDCGEYGWTEWISSAECADRDALGRYYHRLGQLNAIAWLAGANDLHSENIVAAGDRPYLVDTETLLTAIQADGQHTHAGPGVLLESSVSTGILPVDAQLDRSAYGDLDGQLSAVVGTWTDAGTGAMRMERRRLPQMRPNSLPRGGDGRPVSPFDFAAQFAAGSERVLTAIARAGSAIAADSSIAEVWRGTRSRALLRDTATYGQIVEVLSHPAVLHNPFLAEGAFQCLLDGPAHPDAALAKVAFVAERRAVLRGDVPYFDVDASGRDVRCCDGTVIDGFFAGSPVQRLRARAARARAELPALLWATRASLRCAALNAARPHRGQVCCQDYADAATDAATNVDAALAIGRRIAALAQFDGGEVCWLSLSSGGEDRWRVVAADHSLYLGTGGILLFLETLRAITGVRDEGVERVRQRLRAQWEASDPAVLHHGIGAFDGLAGDLYLSARLHRRPRVARVVELLGQQADGGLDVLSGAAGAVLTLCRLGAEQAEAARPHVERLLTAAEPAQAGLTWPTLDGQPLVGYAHGSCGIALALTEFARHTADTGLARRCVEAADAAHRWERSTFDPAIRNWPDLRPAAGPEAASGSFSWCNGSTGIGLARAAVLRHRPESAELVADLEIAVETSLRSGLGVGQGLCHGDLGVAETLLVAAQSTGRQDWLDTARRLGGMVAADVLANGGQVTLEFGSGVDLTGLIIGAAGVGYELLRLAAPDKVPSVLLLEYEP